jgi:rSAM/selenodomain-associated transferase 1
MSHFSRAALVIFAKHPKRGQVKTRLVPPLSPEQALALHVACLQSVARLAASLPPATHKFLYLASPSLASARRAARSLALPRGLKVKVQSRGNLGRRLARAFAELQAEGYERVVVVGTDSPTMPPVRLRQAFAAVRRADAVLGPTRDGGYYLIGLRLPRAGLTRLLSGIDWGTPRTYRQTKAHMVRAKLRLKALAQGYDVDVAADLVCLRQDLGRSPRLQPLRKWFAELDRKDLISR